MKAFKIGLVAFLMLSSVLISVKAQGWVQNKKSIYSVGMGLTQVMFIPLHDYPLNHKGSVGISVNVSGEYKAHRFIGVGWQTGISVFPSGRYYDKPNDIYYNSTFVGIPFGFKVNFHILEAANVAIKDRLDVYAGLNLGGGPSFYNVQHIGIHGFIYGGAQVGIRYWVKKIAVFAELGWGANIANIGITF